MGYPTFAPTGRLTGPYNYFHCSSVVDTGGSSSALTHFVAGSSSGSPVSGWLHGVVVNTALAGPGPVTIWDGLGSSTTPIAVIASSNPGTYTYDCGFTNWLTVGVTSSSASPNDVTLTYAVNNA